MKDQDSKTNTLCTRLSKKLLKEISSSIGKTETLDTLIDILESANDPDPSELYLLESLYQLKEKLKVTESRIDSYLIKNRDLLPGNKLNDLYNNKRSIGTSILFDD
jgi:hypothetical protein